MEEIKIDFVLTWVDGNDGEWQKDKENYWIQEGNTPYQDGNKIARFRDWENLRYWFRGVEKYTPWVNKIYFITYGHIPKWLDVNNPKLCIVNHKDFIPNEYLPVFNINPIEINFHRIEELSEHFVYFNDDTFIINKMEKEDFFVKGKPREMGCTYLLTNNGADDTFQYMLFNMMGKVNKNFDFHRCVKKNWRKWFKLAYGKHILSNFLLLRFNSVSGLLTPHVPSSLTKSIYKEVWDVLKEEMTETCTHRFRNPRDITQYIFRYWAIMKGDFEPTNMYNYCKDFYVVDDYNKDLLDTIKKQKYKMICINDSIELKEFEEVKKDVIDSFETILNEKSSFEL